MVIKPLFGNLRKLEAVLIKVVMMLHHKTDVLLVVAAKDVNREVELVVTAI